MASSNPTLTAEQRVAVEIFDAPIAMIAGAGSGKTRVLVERFIALVARGVDPSAILTVTFTNEAAEELKSRTIHALVEREQSPEKIESVRNSPWIGTIHSFCYRVFEQYGSCLGQPKITSIADDFQLSRLFAKHFDQWMSSIPETTFRGLLKHFTANDLYEIAEILFLNDFHVRQNQDLLKDEDHGNRILKRLWQLLVPLLQAAREELHGAGSFTFNELETSAFQLLTAYPHVKNRLQAQFQFLLIDEFQDTAKIQWQILEKLLDPDWKKLFIVGDPKQSIYGFRHAEVGLFSQISRQVQERGGVVQTLSLNFRTHNNLLEHVNQASERLFHQSEVAFHKMKAGREGFGPAIQIVQYAGREDSSRQAWQDQEIESIVKHVAHKIRNENVASHEIALLFRNSDRMKDYVEALRAEGFPIYADYTSSLFETYDILDLLHYLEAVEDPYNDFALSAFLSSPYMGYNAAELHTLIRTAQKEEIPLYEALVKNSARSSRWFIDLIESGTTGTVQILEILFLKSLKFPEFYEGLFTLLKPVLEVGNLSGAVQALRVWKKQGVLIHREIGSANEGVRLMTVHGAKGLEFPHVFFADALRQPPHRQPPLLVVPERSLGLKFRTEDGFSFSAAYENVWASIKGREDEEAKRILYVAMTRARESLSIFLPKGMKTFPKGSWAALLDEILKKKGEPLPGETGVHSPLNFDSLRTKDEPNPSP